MKKHWLPLAAILSLLLLGCTGLTKGSTVTQPAPEQLAITPSFMTILGDTTQDFVAKINGTDAAVNWSVNGVAGGNGTVGTISPAGGYKAPEFPPSPNTVTIGAIEISNATKKASVSVTLYNASPQIASIEPPTIPIGNFTLTVTGAHFATGTTISFGSTILATTRISSTQLTATGTASQPGNVMVSVTNPGPGSATSGTLMAQVVPDVTAVSAAAAVRFLEQSTFGPSPEEVSLLQKNGFDAFLQDQFVQPVSGYPVPASTDKGLAKVQRHFFYNAVNANDQLRQRMALVLNEIWVISENKIGDPTAYTNYLMALTPDSLGNYYNLMKDVTLTPAMGNWLDMVNNDKPEAGQHANENYARELMQLFTLGVNKLHPDGTTVLDASGNPIPTYTQDDVMALGRSLTGWTYSVQPGKTSQMHNPNYYGGPMIAVESNHDAGAKTFLGQSVPAGQSAENELDNVLSIIFNHPNLPPFIARQFIEKLVTSNPSPAYVQRVAQAFSSGQYNSYGSGKRGDLKALVAAILLDAEARQGDSAANANGTEGKLREPIVMMVSVARAFHAKTDGSGFEILGAGMSQDIFDSPTVFNFFRPTYTIPQSTLNGPEFGIFSTSTSLARMNFINTAVNQHISATTQLDFGPVIKAGSPDQMLVWLNNIFLHGTMSDSMKQSILTAVRAISTSSPLTTTDLTNQAQTAIYLVLSSPQYQVQR